MALFLIFGDFKKSLDAYNFKTTWPFGLKFLHVVGDGVMSGSEGVRARARVRVRAHVRAKRAFG